MNILKQRKPSLTLSILMVFLLTSNLTYSQCVLSCSNVNVSLDENCLAEITPSIISETQDSTCLSMYKVEIYDLNGNLIPTSPFVGVANVNQNLIGHLIDTTNGNYCTDTILVEDKVNPSIVCPIDTGIYVMEIPDTMLTGSAIGTDGCGDVILSYSDITSPFGTSGSDTIDVITRTWIATDSSGNSDTCAQLIYLIHPSLTLLLLPIVESHSSMDMPSMGLMDIVVPTLII